MGVNYFRYLDAPKGTIVVENADTGALPRVPKPTELHGGGDADWPSYNKTLTSERFSALDQITAANASNLKVLCTFDTGQYTGFNTGLLEVQGSLVFTTEYDIFSINPNDCRQNWRVHEDYTPATAQGVSRGPAYLDGRLFRGTQDGRVLAYDFKTGKRLWETSIADPKKGESAPAAPIAWNGLVFIGNAGGDIKGVKGRMYALDAKYGQNRLGILSRSESARRSRARPAGAVAARRLDLEDAQRVADHRRRDLDLLFARSRKGAALRARWQSGAGFRGGHARGRKSLFGLGRRARRQDRRLQNAFQDRAEGLARLGHVDGARADPVSQRQEP